MKIKSILSLMLALSLLAGGCKTVKENKRTAIGLGTGVAVGGALGAILGKKAGNTAGGVVIGAAVGGVAGGAIGRYMDKQKKDIEKDLGENAKVERVGEGINVTFNSGILFPVNSEVINAATQDELRKFAETLNKYPDTYVLIDGHTDNTGSDTYNQQLSVKRAEAVSTFLKNQGVASSRLGTRGFGESQPVADNSTEAGRQANRRVGVAIWANEKLKEEAQKGTLDAKTDSKK
jgi:outer membrane protein OmpA-like peptidoglycan-associated protein